MDLFTPLPLLRRNAYLLLAWLLLLAAPAARAQCPTGVTLLYVNQANTTSGNGATWATAYQSLGDAVYQASQCPAIAEIWVAAGTYLPTRDANQNPNPGDARQRTFYLRGGLMLYGGFAGTETTLGQRLRNGPYETILSGDLNGNDSQVINITDNACHVVLTVGANAATGLDGLTVASGGTNTQLASQSVNGVTITSGYGGGMANFQASVPTVTNCIFRYCTAFNSGGGMYNNASAPTVTHCTFDTNLRTEGPALFNASGSAPAIIQCVFSNNQGATGALANVQSSPTVTACLFVGNVSHFARATGTTGSAQVSGFGGGMFNVNASPLVTNCVFASNMAPNGAGIYNLDAASPVLVNCTFSGNSIDSGNTGSQNTSPGGDGVGVGLYCLNAGGTVRNCLFQDKLLSAFISSNTSNLHREEIYKDSATPTLTVSYSSVSDYSAATTNVTNGGSISTADPLFVNVTSLNGSDGLFGTPDDGLNLRTGSPAIDTGDPTGAPATDLASTPRSTPPDQGAYEALEPIITNFQPRSGPVGTVVTLTGTNLGGATSVRFGEVPATTFSVNAAGTSLTVTVPRLASTQPINVTVGPNSGLTAMAFSVTRRSPVTSYPQAPNLQNASGGTISIGNGAPALADLDGNGRLDLLVGDGSNVRRFEQTSATALPFAYVANLAAANGGSVATGSNGTAPVLTDLDGNGLLDLLLGSAGGYVLRYEQTAARAVTFTSLGRVTDDSATPVALSPGTNTAPTLTDLDGNGLLDLLVGNAAGNVLRYEQTARNATTFTSLGTLKRGTQPIGVGGNAVPTVADLDGNGLLDLLIGNATGTLARYEQTAANAATFALATPAQLTTVVLPGAHPTITDLDNDGLLDVLVGTSVGSIARLAQEAFAIASVSPAANARTAAASSPVVVRFNAPLAAAAGAGLSVFSSQRGGLRTGAAPAVVSGNTLTYTPSAYSFRPGEVVSTTVTTAATSSGGEVLAQGRVTQFVVATGGTGVGNFGSGSAVPVGGSNPGPQAVAVADVNSDGLPDLLTANKNTNTVSVRLGTGGGAFAGTGQEVPVGATPFKVVAGDLNNDGVLDLVTANLGANSVSVRLGGGSGGSFSFATTGLEVSLATRARTVALGDFNGDGYLDVVAASRTSNAVSIVLNASSGGTFGFAAPTSMLVTSLPYGVAVGDVNNDGVLDVLTAEYNSNTVSVLPGNGDGTFASPGLSLNTGSSPQGLALGDLNGDNLPDVVVANTGAGTLSVFLQSSPGGLPTTASSTLPAGTYPDAVVLGDVDADGDLDMAATNYGSNNVTLLLNNGSGTFTAPAANASPAVGQGPQGLALADVDNDGDLDLLTANETDNNVRVLLNQPAAPVITDFNAKTGPVGTSVIITGTNLAGATSVRFGEVPAPAFSASADGTSLTVTVPRLASTQKISVTTPGGAALTATAFAVTRASASLVFNPVGNVQDVTATPADLYAGPWSRPALADLDGNGRLDLLVGNNGGYVQRYEQTAPTAVTFTAKGNVRSGSADLRTGNYAMPALTDLDGNGLLDLLVGNSSGTVQRYEQLAPNAVAFTAKGNVQSDGADLSAGNSAAPTVTDLDGNGRLDLLVGNSLGSVKRYEQLAVNATSFAYVADVQANGSPLQAARYTAPTVSDLDGNGLLDLLVGNSYGSLVLTEQVAAGATTFGPASDLRNSSGPIRVLETYSAPVVTDLDNDGRLDILVGNYNGTLVRYVQVEPLLLVSRSPVAGARAATATSVSATFSQPLATGAAAGLRVFGSQRGGRNTLATVSGSTLTYTPAPAGAAFAPGEVVFSTLTTAVVGTPTNDPLFRPLVAQFTAATSGTGRGDFQARPAVGVGTGPQAVAVADINNDGQPDLLTANKTAGTVSVRLGTAPGTFAATGQEVAVGTSPVSLALGDLNYDGFLDVATANYDAGTVSVRLGSSSGLVASSVSFAVGTHPRSVALGDVNGDGRLDLLAANNNDNTVSVLLNDSGSGTFGFASNASVAVGSGPYQMVLGDVDGDGALDLLTANYGGTVSVCPGAGDGTFPAAGNQSLTVGNVQGNALQALALGDLNADNRPDLVVANTGGSALAVFLQNAAGGFPASPSSTLPAGTYPDAVVLGDMDADGDLDMAATNFGSNNVTVRLNNGSGTFTAPALNASPAVGSGPQGLALADVDSDGDLDLLTANEISGTVSVLLNQAPTVPVITDFAPKSGPAGTVVTVTGSNLGGVTGVRLGGQPVPFTSGGATALSFTVPAAAVRQAFTLSTLAASVTSSQPFVVTQPSAALRLPAAPLNGTTSGLATGQTYVVPTVTDLEGNNRLDVLVGTHGGGVLRYEQTAVGATSFGSASSLSFSNGVGVSVASGALTVTDLDGDGLLDLLVGSGGNVRRYAQSGLNQPTFALGSQSLLQNAAGTAALDVGGNGAAAPAVADLDGNGLLDLLVGNFDGQVRRYEQTAPRVLTFTDRGLLTTNGTAVLFAGSYAHPVLTDLDGNGLLDLLLGTDTQNVRRYEQASAGSAIFPGGSLLTTDGTAPVGAYYGAPAITDLDGNGRYDLLVGDAAGNLTRYEQATSAPLPVQLVTFTATAQGDATVALAWATASEINSARFEVERSTDGTAFAKIGQQAGAGSKTTHTDYTWLDHALPAGARRLYYRLRQVDVDGTAHYSPVRNVALSGAAGLSLYPNPTSGAATLTGAEPGTSVRVYDALGREVATGTADTAGTATLVLPQYLAQGVYTVRVGGQKPLRLVLE